MSTAAHGGAAPPPTPADAPAGGTGRVRQKAGKTPDTGRAVDRLPDDAGVIDRVAAVMADAHLLAKTERNEQQGYAFASEGAMVEMLRPLLAAARLVLWSTIEDVVRYDVQFRNSRGSGVSVRLTYTLIGPLGDALEPVTWWGDATDNADKALPKALTAAKKAYLVHAFMLSTGVDPDGGGETSQRAQDARAPGHADQGTQPVMASPAEIRRAFAVAHEHGVDRDKVRLFAHLASRGPDAPTGRSIHDLTRREVRQVVHWIENYGRKRGEYDTALGVMAAQLDAEREPLPDDFSDDDPAAPAVVAAAVDEVGSPPSGVEPEGADDGLDYSDRMGADDDDIPF